MSDDSPYEFRLNAYYQMAEGPPHPCVYFCGTWQTGRIGPCVFCCAGSLYDRMLAARVDDSAVEGETP